MIRSSAEILVRHVHAHQLHFRFIARERSSGVQVNAVGTNFMDFPEFLRANRAEDPEGRARVEAQVPMGRLGTLEELAQFSAPFVDGSSRFVTGQFVPFAGGWV